MPSPRQLSLLVNAGGAALGAVILGYIAYSAWYPADTTAPACSTRYPAPTRFALANADGGLLSPIELQARAGRSNLGVLENASVVPIEGGPAPEALEVQLRDLGQSATDKYNGMVFRWSPPGLTGATSACLAYGLWLPDKFAFGEGGVLPGVFGSQAVAIREGTNANDGLWGRAEWDGAGHSLLTASLEGGSRARISAGKAPALATGRWTRIEQETVLNTPGKPDGVLRLWIDGKLIVEGRRVAWRTDPAATLSGILAGAGYKLTTAQPSLLRLTNIELAWR